MSLQDQELLERLNHLLDKSSVDIAEESRLKLVGFVLLINKWNKAYNLTSIRDPFEMLVKHIMDSLAVAPFITGKRIADVGTGPGLPGIPLAIIYPEKQFYLVDSLGKRIRFIKQVLHDLDIKNVHAIQTRVEDFQPNEKFDNILSRAFASLSDMLIWCQHLVAEDGYFLALKGQIQDQELNSIPELFSVVESVPLRVPSLVG